MSDLTVWKDDNDRLSIPALAAGQLATPALSPISEHGGEHVEAFPAYRRAADKLDERLDPAQTGGTVPSLEQEHNGPLDMDPRRRGSSGTQPKSPQQLNVDAGRTLKLSPQKLHDLVSSPENLPVRSASSVETQDVALLPNGLGIQTSDLLAGDESRIDGVDAEPRVEPNPGPSTDSSSAAQPQLRLPSVASTPGAMKMERPTHISRSASSPSLLRKQFNRSGRPKPELSPLKTGEDDAITSSPAIKPSPKHESQPSPMLAAIPVPPLSLPTYLQLELSSERPSALYLHHSATSDFPYESSRVKFERLLNFLLLPPSLEQVLWFGAIACLDAWLYTFTILPLRFLKALAILAQWWAQTALKEVHDLSSFIYDGIGRVWKRRRESSVSQSRRPSFSDAGHSRRSSVADGFVEPAPKMNGNVMLSTSHKKPRKTSAGFRHRRTRSRPSALLPNHKADILQGLLIISSCFLLMWFDASRMYHSIRGQSAIKLYVIYNVLEVFDRLFAALGQDILECLFSKETLERNENGRSKIIQPLWMFMLALVYNIIHATALFYQVVTLNVAVNSYSNALLTLLMSNQFVEIKGTVFKKFEKENLFQLTCADIVERFQLWLMLLIIALRNIVEVGGLSISLNSAFTAATDSSTANTTGMPLTAGFIIPKAFTLFPKWTGEVLGPFLIVLGSEALVDWCKHAYIGKFNNVKPNIYGRFLDVLAKDYYTHALGDQNLTKRLGLPIIPLSCLFIRACMQTYHMFLATHVPPPFPSSATAVALESETTTTSPATTAALQHIDLVFRRALGRSSFGAGGTTSTSFSWWSIDDVIALATMVIFFLALYLVLLACKLVLGMLLLSFARSRYTGMKERERQGTTTDGRRVGGWGMVEVSEEKRRWIYDDDANGLKELKEKEEKGRKSRDKGDRLDAVDRYMMAAKRIW